MIFAVLRKPSEDVVVAEGQPMIVVVLYVLVLLLFCLHVVDQNFARRGAE